MRQHIMAAGLVAATVAGLDAAASAQQASPYAPRGAVSQGLESGFYVWLDGAYHNVSLPAYRLGLHAATRVALQDRGSVQTIEPHVDGGGFRGAIGYAVPGTGARFEFGGSYVQAKASDSSFTSTSDMAIGTQFVDGRIGSGYVCSTAVFFGSCNVSGVLNSEYTAWQFNGKVAAERTLGSVKLTPFVAVFGGNTRALQSLSQSFAYIDNGTGLTTTTGRYSANTDLKWTDIGARAGFDLHVPVSAALTIGFTGWLGAAGRETSLSARDSASDTFANFDGSGALSTRDNKTVLLANAETGFAYKLTPAAALRGFVGLNYDGGVPGIATPSFAGSFAIATSGPAAAINYHSETSYYAGGGVTVKFGP